MSDVFNRVIPCLLLLDGGLVKSKRFARPRYIGDPINAVRIFNDKYVDELIFLDISASRNGAEPDYDLVSRIAGECFMPLCYGGGIRKLEQARRLVTSGVEKIAVNSMAIDHPEFLSELSDELGASSVVAGIDFIRDWRGKPRVYHPGRRRTTSISPVEQARAVVAAGAGEILLNSVDRDGMRSGFDLEVVRDVAQAVPVPVVACGGADCLADMRAAIDAGASAAAAGSMFVFYGPLKAVLISYPEYAAVRSLFAK
jgi:cyclase